MQILHCSIAFCIAFVSILLAWALQVWPNPAETICCSRRTWCKVLRMTNKQEARLDHDCGSAGESLNTASVENDGFAVVRNFLKDDELADLVELHRKLPEDENANAGYNSGYTSPSSHVRLWDLMPALHARIHNVTAKIAQETTVKAVDAFGQAFTDSIFMHTNASVKGSIKFPWHQDHDSYLQNQDHHNYLNFYIMLEKKHPQEAGLQIVPWSALRSNNPELYQKVVGGGATGFIKASELWNASATPASTSEITYVHQDAHDKCFGMSFNIGTLACTPELKPGDVLILRGDTIHRTQPHNAWRSSLSVRVFPAQTAFNVTRMMGSGAEAFRRMSHTPDVYGMRALGLGKTHDTWNATEVFEKFTAGGWNMWLSATWFQARFYANYLFRKGWAELVFIPIRDGSLPKNNNIWR